MRIDDKNQVVTYLRVIGLVDAVVIYNKVVDKDSANRSKVENLIVDLVDKNLTYGHLTVKQQNFLRDLIYQHKNPATPCPKGKIVVKGVIRSYSYKFCFYSKRDVCKIVIRDSNGFSVWGTAPKALVEDYDLAQEQSNGTIIAIAADVTPSDKDETFGFFKRPKLVSVEKPA